MFRIYALVNPWNHKYFYIGQTRNNLPARLAEVKYEWKNGKDGTYKHRAITCAMALSGGKISIVQIDHCFTQEEADRKERWWIDFYHKLGILAGNTSAGGAGNHGVKRGTAQRKKISKSVKAYQKRHRLLLNLISPLIPLITANKSPST